MLCKDIKTECGDCPYAPNDYCLTNDNENILLKDALDLINRKKAEIEQEIKEIKSEAIKEFAERLKKKCYEDFQETDEMLCPYVTEMDIDDLAKEMTEAQE